MIHFSYFGDTRLVHSVLERLNFHRRDEMGVKVKLPNHLQAKAMKTAVIEIEGRTVNECLAELTRRYPNLKGDIIDGRGNMLITWMVSINGEISTGPSELSHPVNDGDLLELLPMIAGG